MSKEFGTLDKATLADLHLWLSFVRANPWSTPEEQLAATRLPEERLKKLQDTLTDKKHNRGFSTVLPSKRFLNEKLDIAHTYDRFFVFINTRYDKLAVKEMETELEEADNHIFRLPKGADYQHVIANVIRSRMAREKPQTFFQVKGEGAKGHEVLDDHLMPGDVEILLGGDYDMLITFDATSIHLALKFVLLQIRTIPCIVRSTTAVANAATQFPDVPRA